MVCEFYLSKALYKGFPGSPEGQESALGLIPGSGGSPREWLPTPAFLPGDFHGQRSLAGYGPWGRKESDKTEQLTLSLSKLL